MHEWHRAIFIQSHEIKRRLWTLGAIGCSAPLLGVLCASDRLTEAFQHWYAAEGSSFAPFADEASSALWGISFGIVVAGPAIWAYRYFCAQIEAMLLETRDLSLAIIEQLSNRHLIFTNESGNRYITSELKVNSTGSIGC
jgi:biopolymer transport protein ExbB/TolQ